MLGSRATSHEGLRQGVLAFPAPEVRPTGEPGSALGCFMQNRITGNFSPLQRGPTVSEAGGGASDAMEALPRGEPRPQVVNTWSCNGSRAHRLQFCGHL